MKFLVISDIHAISKDIHSLKGYGEKKPSVCFVEDKSTLNNPLLAIPEVLKDFHGQIAGLLFLGDLAHQAKSLPLREIWRDLHGVAKKLEIPIVLAVTGNHDIASRETSLENMETGINLLSEIVPSFPTSDPTFNSDYFSNGVSSKDIGDVTIVGVDTCRLHGLGGPNAAEIFNVGSITDDMISRIVSLINSSAGRLTILMMHHHPQKADPHYDEQNDVMRRGEQLFHAIGSLDKPILVIHGHKHLASLNYVQVGSKDIPVFSSASLSAVPFGAASYRRENLFHLIELESAEIHTNTGKLGAVISWHWMLPNIWKRSNLGHMPHTRVFGRKPILSDIKDKVIQLQTTKYLNQVELVAMVPDVAFLNAEEIAELNDALNLHGKVIISERGELKGLVHQELR